MTTTEEETPETEEPEPDEPDEEETEQEEQEPAAEDRCLAETVVGGTRYRCALTADHDDEHRFQPVLDESTSAVASDKERRKGAERLAAEAERHAKRIREIMGDDANELVACELCNPTLGGWRFDVAPSEETTQRVRSVIGLPDVSNFAMSATERICDDCRGLGKVRTGSIVPGRETITCDACAGKGYVASRPRLNADAIVMTPADEENGAHAYVEDGVKRDMFGTPEGDPDYNLMPNARRRPTDYWQQNRS